VNARYPGALLALVQMGQGLLCISCAIIALQDPAAKAALPL